MALLSGRRGISDASTIRVKEDRLRKDLLDLARHGEEQDGGVMCTALSDADMQARRWFKDRMSEAGLRVREDAAASIIGRLDPTADSADAPFKGAAPFLIMLCGKCLADYSLLFHIYFQLTA